MTRRTAPTPPTPSLFVRSRGSIAEAAWQDGWTEGYNTAIRSLITTQPELEVTDGAETDA